MTLELVFTGKVKDFRIWLDVKESESELLSAIDAYENRTPIVY